MTRQLTAPTSGIACQLLIAAIVSIALLAGSASAAVTHVDFSDTSGTPALTSWNHYDLWSFAIPAVANGSSASLTADDGSTDLTIGNVAVSAGERGFESSETPDMEEPAWIVALGSDEDAAVDNNWLFDNDDNGGISTSFDISGFDPSEIVTFRLWAGRYDNGTDLVDYTINGAFSDGNVSDNFNFGTNGNSGGPSTDLVWSDLTGQSTYTFTATNSRTLDRRLGFNALRIEVIPEPASAALLSLAGLALLRRRRRTA